MNLEDSLQRIIRDNQRARLRSSDRMSRLVDASVKGDDDGLRNILDDILNPVDGGEPLEPDGETEGVDRSDRESEASGRIEETETQH